MYSIYIYKYITITIRDALRHLITNSDSRLSIGKIDQFIKDTFGASQTVPLELFLNNFLDVQNNFYEKFQSKKPKECGSSDVAEIIVEIDQLKNLVEDEFEIEEPDLTRRGAFFHSDGQRL